MENRDLLNGILDLIEMNNELKNEVDFYHGSNETDLRFLSIGKREIVNKVMTRYSILNDKDMILDGYDGWVTSRYHCWSLLPSWLSIETFVSACDKELHDFYNDECNIVKGNK